MPRLIAFLLILLCPAAATGGIRATYAVEEAGTLVVEIADNGDVDAEMERGRRLIVKAGEAFVVLDRLTGPIVMRLDDLAALGQERPASAAPPAQGGAPDLIERGTAEIGGRTGRAFFAGWDPNHPQLVISADPALAELAPVLRRLLAASSLLSGSAGRIPTDPKAIWSRCCARSIKARRCNSEAGACARSSAPRSCPTASACPPRPRRAMPCAPAWRRSGRRRRRSRRTTT